MWEDQLEKITRFYPEWLMLSAAQYLRYPQQVQNFRDMMRATDGLYQSLVFLRPTNLSNIWPDAAYALPKMKAIATKIDQLVYEKIRADDRDPRTNKRLLGQLKKYLQAYVALAQGISSSVPRAKLASTLIHHAASLPVGDQERRDILATILDTTGEDDDFSLNFDLRRGFAVVSGPGNITLLARHLNRRFLPRWQYSYRMLNRPKGVIKTFSFHWSNAQRAWDVILIREPSTSVDGSEFMVYITKNAVTPIGKPWALREMEYVAAKLEPHPGS